MNEQALEEQKIQRPSSPAPMGRNKEGLAAKVAQPVSQLPFSLSPWTQSPVGTLGKLCPLKP